MKKVIFSIIVMIFFISFISSVATINKNYDIKLPCEDMNCSRVNITIVYPNSTILTNNKPMTNNVYFVNYTLNPTINGVYSYFYSDGANSSEGTFTTTSTGNDLSSSQMFLYFFIGIILILLFILCLYGALNIPFANERNQNSEIVAVNWKKYLNIFCWGMSYLLLLSVVFVTYNLIYAYAQWDKLALLFKYFYTLLIKVFPLPVLIGIGLITLINVFNDVKINAFIKKMGLPYNEI